MSYYSQVYTQNENLKITIPGFTQALVESYDENKETKKKNDCRTEKALLKGGLHKAVSEDWLVQF